MQGPLIGIIAGAICFWACTWLKLKLGYDDSLDVFGVNGVGGFTGTLLAGVLAVGAISASPEMPGGVQGLLEGTALWHRGHAGVVGSDDFHHPQVIGALVGLRVRQEDEVMGLDVSLYGEALQ
jgi:Amt family ammonium transporter